ncbi:MAG: hypothetical protein KBB83_06695 [Alphaproteobacteria bacterium]|nr:hypothetical protein [Alphaproteobacteria bacterium]
MNQKELFEMELHSFRGVYKGDNDYLTDSFAVLRVPGGLLYRSVYKRNGDSSVTMSMCFVPEPANHISDSGKKVRHEPTSMSVGSDINVGSKLDDMDATVREFRSVEENSSMAPSVKKLSSLPPEEMLTLHRLIDVESYIRECAPDRCTHIMSVGDIRFMARTIKGLMGIL